MRRAELGDELRADFDLLYLELFSGLVVRERDTKRVEIAVRAPEKFRFPRVPCFLCVRHELHDSSVTANQIVIADFARWVDDP